MTDWFREARTVESDAPAQSDGTDWFKEARAGGQDVASLDPQSRVGSFAPPQQLQAPQQNTAMDIAKGIGSGAVKGVLAVGSTPGNLEWLARAGIDKAGGMMGYDPQMGKGQMLPTYSDYKSDLERRVGTKLYDAQTVPGQYAQTAAEFLPLALSPGSAAQRATRVAVPAVASETAGQATKGTSFEPYARMGAAVLGSMAPGMMSRAVSPNQIPPERAAQLAVLEREGVTATTAGQRTGSRPLMWAESVTQDTPFAGGRAAQMQVQQGEQFTAAALRRAGVQNATRATPDVIDDAFTRLGGQFDNLAQNATLRPDQRLATDLRNAVADYQSVTAPTLRAPIVENIVRDVVDVMRQPGGQLSGEAYQSLRSSLDRAARNARMSNPQLSEALFSIRNSFDSAVERNLPQNMRGQWAQTRREYRNLIAIEKAATGAGSDAAMGIISPAKLREAAKAQNSRDYARGRGDLAELARAGQAIMTPLPQSGTAPRAAAQGALQVLSGIGGYGAAGAPGAVGAVMAPAMAARTLMSQPVQNYLSNQLAVGMQPFARRSPLADFVAPGMIIGDDANALMP